VESQASGKEGSEKTSKILNNIIKHGYLIEPEALEILESLSEEKVMEILKKLPDTIFIETEQVKEALEANEKRFKPVLKGRITKIYDGSGLIQRCPKCGRWIIDDFCMVHGEVAGKWDLRIKAGLDDGKKRHTLIFQREITEKILKLTLEGAKELGEEEILERIKREVVGKSAEIDGSWMSGGNFLVSDIRVT